MEKKIGRFLDENSHPQLGVFTDDYVQSARGDLFGELVAYGEPKPLTDVRILPPVRPSKIIGIGSNYRRHIQEMGRPTRPSAASINENFMSLALY